MRANELTAEASRSVSGQGIQVTYEATPPIPNDRLLAAVHFGAGAAATDTALKIHVQLDPALGPVRTEWWWAIGPVQRGVSGLIRYASDERHLFGVIELDEREHGGIADTAAIAYAAIGAFQHASAFPHLLRMWNYLDAINEGEGDLERYRQFCVGRARGLGTLMTDMLPAATAIGHQRTTHRLQVFWLASRVPGTALENPRQVSAYRYPRIHGPVSPSFARATLSSEGSMLISGTASIVGHSSLHNDNADAQLDETLRNLSALHARMATTSTPARTLLKVYVRHPDSAPAIAQRLAAALPEELRDTDVMFLAADICRRELLVEIEGIRLPAPAPP